MRQLLTILLIFATVTHVAAEENAAEKEDVLDLQLDPDFWPIYRCLRVCHHECVDDFENGSRFYRDCHIRCLDRCYGLQ